MNGGSVLLIVAIAALVLYVVAFLVKKTVQAARGDPTFWAAEIRRFERKDRRGKLLPGVVVFTGSSSIRFWKTLEQDMAPIPVVNRGFGGSQIHQVTYYAERIIFPYEPRGVVLYAGENDIAGAKFSQGKTAQEVLEAFKQFRELVFARFPEIPIYFVSIKPPKLRLKFWPEMQRANDLIATFCGADPRLHFIDVATAMLDADGRPRQDVFKWDGIHMNQKGYDIWISVIKPVMEQAFLNK